MGFFMEPMMGQVLIRDLDDDVIAAMKSKAKLYGRSLESQLRAVIESAAPFTVSERVKAAEYLQNLGDAEPVSFDVNAAIRFGRDDAFDEPEAEKTTVKSDHSKWAESPNPFTEEQLAKMSHEEWSQAVAQEFVYSLNTSVREEQEADQANKADQKTPTAPKP